MTKRILGSVLFLAVVSVALGQHDYFHRPSSFAGTTLLTLSAFDEVRKDMQVSPEIISREDGLLLNLQREFDDLLQRSKGNYSSLRPAIDKLNARYDFECLKLFTSEQTKMLKEQFVQFNGGKSITNPVIARDLGISDEQKDQIAEVQSSNSQKSREVYKTSPSQKEIQRLRDQLDDELKNRLEALLDESQHEKYLKLRGPNPSLRVIKIKNS
jgi:hypothetical protein